MRLAVFASGGGSNLQAILDAIETGSLSASVQLVVSDREGAGALDRAVGAGIADRVIAPQSYPDQDAFGTALLKALEDAGVEMVALAGYLRHVPSNVVKAYSHRMLNVHPSLLPAFGGKGLYGMRVHRAVLEYGVQWTGATVHLVDEEYDTGPIVLQQPVQVAQDDTPESLAARVLAVEHELYVSALRLFAQKRVRVDGRRCIIEGP